ncbi:unnamed protein product, partial [Prorocentrum cordatum]
SRSKLGAMPLAIILQIGIALRCATALQLPRGDVGSGSSNSSLPIISLRLAPGARPLPDVAATVASLVAAREALESELWAGLRSELAGTLENASLAIQGAAAAAKSRVDDRGRENLGAGSLFASEDGKNVNGNYSSVRVAVERRAPVGGAALAKIKSIEQKQRQAEILMFEQASEEMRVLTS